MGGVGVGLDRERRHPSHPPHWQPYLQGRYNWLDGLKNSISEVVLAGFINDYTDAAKPPAASIGVRHQSLLTTGRRFTQRWFTEGGGGGGRRPNIPLVVLD